MTAERWLEVKDIFQSAVECDPPARAALLLERCGHDQELFREVQSLLSSDGETGVRLESPVRSLSGKSSDALSSLDRVPAVLRERYEILSELGRGGMGIVYKARDRETGEVLALKILKPEIAADSQNLERFKNEVLLAHRITHPSVARLYEFHRAGPVVYLSMEYVEGESLRAVLQRVGKLDVTRGLEIARQVVAGVAEAHRASIVHRDLKPENIMLAAGGQAKVMDFGISRSYAPGATVTGSLIGTPAYMAPEQIEGKPPGPQSDIYALGLILYEMFTGCSPFRADSPVSLALMQIQVQPKPPHELAPELPVHVERTILRCLEKDRADRFDSVADLLSSLDGNASPLNTRRHWRPSKRSRAVAGGIAALTIAAALGALAFFILNRRAISTTAVPSVAVLPFADLSPQKDQEYFSNGLAEEILNELANTPGLRVTAKTSSFGLKNETRDFQAIGKALNASTLLEGSVRKQENRARVTVQLIKAADGSRLWSDTFDRGLNDIFAVETEIARAVTGSLQVRLREQKARGKSAKNGNPEAFDAYLQGRYFLPRRTEANLAKAVGYFEQATKLDPAYAKAWVGLAEARSGQAGAGYLPPDDAYGMARTAVNRALALDPDLGDAHAALAWILQFHDSDWAGAEQSYRRALALSPGDGTVMSHAATLFRIVGRLDDAVAVGRRATQVDPLSPGNYHNWGVSLYYAGQYEDAKAAFQKALELFPEMEPPHAFLGRVYLAMSQPKEALEEMEKEKNPALRLFGLALSYHALGQKRESDARLAELIRQFSKVATYQIAEVYAFRGEVDKAFDLLKNMTALSQMKGDPLLKTLEADPRYSALLKKTRL
ncbi:MAG: protein kinase [Terriglobia bacterium]